MSCRAPSPKRRDDGKTTRAPVSDSDTVNARALLSFVVLLARAPNACIALPLSKWCPGCSQSTAPSGPCARSRRARDWRGSGSSKSCRGQVLVPQSPDFAQPVAPGRDILAGFASGPHLTKHRGVEGKHTDVGRKATARYQLCFRCGRDLWKSRTCDDLDFVVGIEMLMLMRGWDRVRIQRLIERLSWRRRDERWM